MRHVDHVMRELLSRCRPHVPGADPDTRGCCSHLALRTERQNQPTRSAGFHSTGRLGERRDYAPRTSALSWSPVMRASDNRRVADDVTDLERGRGAYANESWRTAFESLSAAAQVEPLGPGDLELLARSAYMLGRDDEYVGALEEAHRAYLEGGDVPPAVRCAWWIGHNMLFRGRSAQAGGWFARGRRLLEECDDCVERGYLLAPVWLDQMGSGDPEGGCATAAQAAEIGERFGDPDLTWLARDDQARGLIAQGKVTEGLSLVEEVLIAALTDELSPIVTGIVYCNTISFCRDSYELRQAREWTQALTRWCSRQPEMIAHNGLCLVHRAEFLQLSGEWEGALTEARRSATRFTHGALNQIACGQAHYRQGEIHRLRGEFESAESAYREANRYGFEPQPGLSLLRLAQRKDSAAAAAIRRAVGEATEPLRRAGLLPTYVKIMLETGDLDAAHSGGRELARIAEERPNEVIEALSAQVRGTLLLSDGNPRVALVSLRRAVETWLQLEARYEVARLRVLIGLACRALGDEDTASLELETARHAFEELGAVPDLAALDARPKTDAHSLTDRELDVLRHAAIGMSNREIAAKLVISEHTVARHLQNIFAKLGVSSRSAAGAFAFEHDLV
jgi:DNA-binding NarL/FixJ family response regulator